MLERIITHPASRFCPCRVCGGEPRHVLTRGRSSREPFDIHNLPGIRHALECRCGVRTARYALLATAELEWQVSFAQLALSAPHARRAAALPLLQRPLSFAPVQP